MKQIFEAGKTGKKCTIFVTEGGRRGVSNTMFQKPIFDIIFVHKKILFAEIRLVIEKIIL